jgi:glycosyltransferase involved in cell wall biosynthesis
MLVNFLNSEELKRGFNLSFSFRYSELYASGLAKRMQPDAPFFPVYFPDLSYTSPFSKHIPMFARRFSLAFTRLALFWPLLMYEIFVLFRLFKLLSPDVLHINNGGYPAALSARAAAIAGHFAGVPSIVMVVNNIAADYRHYSRWMDYPVDRLVVRAVRVFITGSAAAMGRLQKVLRLPDSKLTRIHNGIAPRKTTASVSATRERLGLASFDGVVFGVVALLIPRKGHQVLLEAVLKLVTEKTTSLHGDFMVLIEGDGPLQQELAAFVRQNDLSGFVKFVGDEKNVVDFMMALDVLVLPSVQDEDFPNVVIEAMALGKPVIASRLAGTPEQVDHGVTGLLVEPRLADQLAGAMIDLMVDSQLRSRMGVAATSCFNNKFTNGKAVANYMNLYNKLIGSVQ